MRMTESMPQRNHETSIPQEITRRITGSWCVTPPQRESSRSSRYESKTELQDIKRKYKDVDHVDEKNGVWNTKVVESMELENRMSQAAQVLNNGETRHESRGNHGHDHEDVLNAKRCSGRCKRSDD